jgi:hypothetical protein
VTDVTFAFLKACPNILKGDWEANKAWTAAGSSALL